MIPAPIADQRVIVGVDAEGVVVAGAQQAVLALGPPRSGKTSAVVIPNLLAAWGPVVSTSTKPDVLAATSAARLRRGRCWLYDPSGTVPLPSGLTPLRWSPVEGARAWDGALLLARALVGAGRPAGLADASHWTERAEALLAPLLHAAAVAGDDATTVLGWVNRRDGRPAAERLGGRGTAADLLAGILATDRRELSGIWSTASGVLAAYRSDAALASAAAPNFDARGFVASGDTVYVCASGRHQELVAPLVVGLVEEVRAAAFERAAARLAAGMGTSSGAPDLPPGLWQPEPPLLLALDEVANVAPLP
ncbi:MAG TPA: type IV secretory system conjugative DNA transfer family protein, partial [Acidimicrobiales bacterium]